MTDLGSVLGGTAVTAAFVAVLAWAIGLDPLSSVFVGTAVLTIGAGRALLLLAGVGVPDPGRPPRPRQVRAGVRSEVAELSWKLTPGRAGVHHSALDRLQVLADRRLAGHGIALRDPAHAAAAARLLGPGAYRVLTAEPSMRVRYRTFLRCLDAVEAIGDPPPGHTHDHRQTAQRATPPAHPHEPAEEATS